MASAAFERYVDEARKGRTALWRTIVGMIVVMFLFSATTVIAVVAITMASGALEDREVAAEIIPAYMASAPGLVLMLASFSGLAFGVWLAVRLLHRRKGRTLLGSAGRISWVNFARACFVAFASAAALEGTALLEDWDTERSAVGLDQWFIRLVPFSLLIFLQIGAEELAFRGYLLQSFAVRFRSWVIWATVPALLFSLGHWSSQVNLWGNLANVFAIVCFAAIATALVYRTGDLGGALGLHFGNNAFVILIISHDEWLSGAALFVGPFFDKYDWTPADVVVSVAFSLVSTLLMLGVLLYRRSPLHVRPLPPADEPPTAAAGVQGEGALVG